MKKIFVSILAVAVLASCSNEETIDQVAPEAIGFDNVFVDNATRTTDSSYSSTNLPDSFLVYGTTQGDEQGAPVVPIFDGVTVSKNGSGVYQYESAYTQYWIAGNFYNFAALVNADAQKVTKADSMPSSVVYTADYTSGNTADLLYATASAPGLATNNPTVGFTFNHLLSNVKFTVTNTMTTNVVGNIYEYVVTDIAINNAYTTGTCALAAKTWSDQTNATKVVAFGNVEAVGVVGQTESASSDYARLLIPATYDQNSKLNVTFTLTTLLNGQSVNVENINLTPTVTFEAGKAYNFVIEKGAPGEEIKFTVTTVNGWVNGTI